LPESETGQDSFIRLQELAMRLRQKISVDNRKHRRFLFIPVASMTDRLPEYFCAVKADYHNYIAASTDKHCYFFVSRGNYCSVQWNFARNSKTKHFNCARKTLFA